MQKILAVFLVTLLLSACQTTPPAPPAPVSKYASDAMAQLIPGVTTEAQTEALFGKPQRESTRNGQTVVGYSHVMALSQAAPNGATRLELLAIKFDRNGKLISYSLNATVGK